MGKTLEMFVVEKGDTSTTSVMVAGIRNAIASAVQFVEYCNSESARVFDSNGNERAFVYFDIAADGIVVL